MGWADTTEGDLRHKPSFWRNIFCREEPMLKEAIDHIIHSGGKGCQVEKKERNLNRVSQCGDISSLPNKWPKTSSRERQHLDILESKFPEVRNLFFLDFHHIPSAENSFWHKVNTQLRSATWKTETKKRATSNSWSLKRMSPLLRNPAMGASLAAWRDEEEWGVWERREQDPSLLKSLKPSG